MDWALYQPIWPGRLGTGIQWSPVESSGVHMDYVGEGKDLRQQAPLSPILVAAFVSTLAGTYSWKTI